jgi:glycosyltransferase involved in cell wall biosynthesis
MKKILFVLPGFPYPAHKNGVAIRYLPVIEHLHKTCEVDLLILAEDFTQTDLEAVSERVNSVSVIPRSKPGSAGLLDKAKEALALLLPGTPPLSHKVRYDHSHVNAELKRRVVDNDYDRIVWVSAWYGAYLKQVAASVGKDKLVLDFIDSPYLRATRNVIRTFGNESLQRYENIKTRQWERQMAGLVSRVCYISKVDAEAIADRDKLAKTHVIPNGIYLAEHSEQGDESVTGPAIGFLGNMSYSPNVDAVLWFYQEVFVKLKAQHADLTFYIIGKDPLPNIQALGQNEGVHVTGFVDNIWPLVNAMTLFALPIRQGAGLKNKVLETLYSRKPVLTTEIGNEGIDAVHGEHVYICDSADDYLGAIEKILGAEHQGREIGERARRYVVENFSWSGVLEKFEQFIL